MIQHFFTRVQLFVYVMRTPAAHRQHIAAAQYSLVTLVIVRHTWLHLNHPLSVQSVASPKHLPTPFTPSPGQPLLHSLLLWIRAFSIYAYETAQLFSFVCLAYCTERNILQFCWCCCKQQDLLYFRLINKLICKIYKDACSLEEKL